MSDPSADRRFPRGALFGAAALVGLAMLLAGMARVTGIGTTESPASVRVDQRELRFEDRADGAVEVYEASSDRVVRVLEPGTNGFVRGVLRGFARERKLWGIGREPAFRLTRWADGRLSLDDPATGRRVELGAFGPTNSGAFAQLLLARSEAR